ncbi:MAG: hypothetical protein MRJ65_06140 [Candidatus Brocadiaceae bacterium]|nr:hypothetical protein [Candidatus Brocadiaceae bacterium]
MAKTAKEVEIFSLHRYYIWANKMRIDFDEVLKKKDNSKIPDNQYEIESNLYMSYWYSAIYVIIEVKVDGFVKTILCYFLDAFLSIKQHQKFIAHQCTCVTLFLLARRIGQC